MPRLAPPVSINHGTLISAFQRHKSQAASTKFLSIFDSASSLRSSDGASLISDEARRLRASGPTYTPAKFQASTSDWGAFIIWKVDINSRKHEQNTASPPEPDWPAPPPMAMSCNPAIPEPMWFQPPATTLLQAKADL